MSRHRAIRNMDLEEELEEEDYDDEEYDMTPDEQAQFEDALDQVYEVIGPQSTSGLDDKYVEDTVWNYRFDAGQSIEHLLQEKERRAAAAERRVQYDDMGLPIPSPGEDEYDYYDDINQVGLASDYLIPQSTGFTKKLSTISERTERTEQTIESRPWPTRQELMAAHEPRKPPSTPTTSSYGNVIHPSQSKFSIHQQLPKTETTRTVGSSLEDYGQVIGRNGSDLDPNTIAPSPSMSALEQLQIRSPSPSPTESASTVQTRPQKKVPPVIPRGRITDIKSSSSTSTTNLPQQLSKSIMERGLSQQGLSQQNRIPRSDLSSMHLGETQPKKSKLASLASSRAQSQKSARSDVSVPYTGSEQSKGTYSALRPKSHTPTSTSFPNSTLEREVDAALREGQVMSPPQQREFEKMKRVTKEPLPFSLLVASPSSVRSNLAHSPSIRSPQTHTSSSRTTPVQKTRQPMMVQSESETEKYFSLKSGTSSGLTTPRAPNSLRLHDVDSPIHVEETVEEQPEVQAVISPTPSKPPLSKLAQLAQAKASSREHASRKIRRPRVLDSTFAETEYLNPTSKLSSITTAITTYTQTIDNMTAYSRAPLPPSYPPAESEGRQSKLAMKARKSNKPSPAKQDPHQEALERAKVHAANLIYSTNLSTYRAEPSSFAALLVNDRSRDKKALRNEELAQREAKKEAERLQRRQRKEALLPKHLLNPAVLGSTVFAFDVPSPDDIVLSARKGTALGSGRRSVASSGRSQNPTTAQKREKAEKAKNKQLEGLKSGVTSAATSRSSSPNPASSSKGGKKGAGHTTLSKPAQQKKQVDQQALDISSLNLDSKDTEEPVNEPPTPKMSMAREKIIEEALKVQETSKKAVSLVVIGHVDAGKSTLMGRLLYELGLLDERKRLANERESNKAGKGSFTWAWEMDGTVEERARGVTMDIATQSLATPKRQITILDAPGHKDFIPNMISGATQADCALLVVDASTGEFEAGFDRGGQTREHLVLVRSLGVNQIIVAVNKLDQVNWEKDRFDEICEALRPFLNQTGFNISKVLFVPVGALSGINLAVREGKESKALNAWYKGPTLVDLLDKLEPPTRAITAPLRYPISNVFKGSTGGIAVSGRICSGVVQVGEQLRILPGDEIAIVRSIEVDDDTVPWAAAGSNATLYLTNVDPIQLNIGSVLCPPTDLVPLTTSFTARIIVFDIDLPLTIGAPVELFHHSYNLPASLVSFIATLDRATGTIVKKSPRVLTKGTSAEVRISLRTTSMSGPASRAQPIPLEPFATNKEMGRLLLRRGGETIAAGIVLDVIPN